ncbi:hypothetical protein TELCIR_02766 [Teladorsagia circumcincta]|uniref:Uncharacterized protein n=1 Tax=Teladorsagia circumcincta TaxID=45464 RepID=A0A2G9V0B9_TELCI|nr:hypothetical protein TELCIR_02766 [Teladorsagia circumcincta]
MQTAPIQLKVREQRLRWYGHGLRRPQDHPVRTAMDFEAQEKITALIVKSNNRRLHQKLPRSDAA